jgi:ubiquinone biosynthesis protein Coq4
MKGAIIILMFWLILAVANTDTVFAQKSPSQNLADEQSVKKFADSFLKSFLNIKNLEKMPPHFFRKIFQIKLPRKQFLFL